MNSIRIFVVLLTISSSLVTVNCLYQAKPSDEECDSLLLKSDKCLQRAIFIADKDLPIPRTSTDLMKICESVPDNLRCILDYKKCLNPFPRSIFNMILKNIKKTVMSFCMKNGKSQQDFLKYMPCFQEGDVQILHNIFDNITGIIDTISNSPDSGHMLPKFCCGYVVINKDLTKKLDEKCASTTGPGTSKFFFSLFSGAMTEAMDLGCAKLQTVEQCVDRFPAIMKKITKLTYGVHRRKPYSLLVPTMQLVKRLDTDERRR